jgi:hypothetical protein
MSLFHKGVAVAVIGAGALAFAGGASARVICNADGDCWHSHDTVVIAPGLHLTEHPDSWRWSDAHRYHWREHAGNGYWEHGEWRSN